MVDLIQNTDDPVKIFYQLLNIHGKLSPRHVLAYFKQRGIPEQEAREAMWKDVYMGELELTRDRHIQRRTNGLH